MEDGKLIITVEYIQHRAFAMRDLKQAANFWRGYISQVMGHKVTNVEILPYPIQEEDKKIDG
jgi:hypothetical protein